MWEQRWDLECGCHIPLLTRNELGVVVVAHITDKEGATNWISDESRFSKLQIVSKASDGSVVVVQYFPAQIIDGDGSWNVTGAGEINIEED